MFEFIPSCVVVMTRREINLKNIKQVVLKKINSKNFYNVIL